jgi:hypothetical protein
MGFALPDGTHPLPGPEYEGSGDPVWIEVPLSEGGALNEVDSYVPYGRWRERIVPELSTPAVSAGQVGLYGLTLALQRLWKAVTPDTQGQGEEVAKESPEDTRDRHATAVASVYDALEWIHSLDEHFRLAGRYRSAIDLDVSSGEFVMAALGARNACHHGLRQVVGYVDVARPIYVARNFRWEHSGEYSEDVHDTQLRWVMKLPEREEAHAEGGTIRSPVLENAFEKHFAGREVRNCIAIVGDFFFCTVLNRAINRSSIFTPADNVVTIDPRPKSDDAFTTGRV